MLIIVAMTCLTGAYKLMLAWVACAIVLLAPQSLPPIVLEGHSPEKGVKNLKKLTPVSGILPWVGCGLEFANGPRAFLEASRAVQGDTFLLRLFGIDMFCVFSPEGLQSLYSAKEADASFTEATKGTVLAFRQDFAAPCYYVSLVHATTIN
jgi:hypothetical protein